MPTIDPVTPKIVTPKGDVAKTPDELRAEAIKRLDAEACAEEIRLRRGEITMLESRLAYVGTHPGWTRRWCNDDGDNLPRRLADGWRFVRPEEVDMSTSVGYGSDDVGDRVSIITAIGGAANIRTYLMEIPTTIAEELLEARSYSKVKAFENAVRRGSVGVSSKDTYLPGETPGSAFQGVVNKIGQAA